MAHSGYRFAGFMIAGLALGACQSGPAVDVPAGAASGDLELRATGSGNWSVACSGVSTRGRDAKADMDGRGSTTDVIVLNGLVSASCAYSAGDAPLTLTLEERGLACPFGTFEEGVCVTTVAAGASGSFAFPPE